MEILICQSCGTLIRSQGKPCKGCGTVASKNNSTTIAQVMQPVGSALAVSLKNDPLVLERTVNHILYGKPVSRPNGNGNGNGNGHDGSAHTGFAYPGASSIPTAPSAATASIIEARGGGYKEPASYEPTSATQDNAADKPSTMQTRESAPESHSNAVATNEHERHASPFGPAKNSEANTSLPGSAVAAATAGGVVAAAAVAGAVSARPDFFGTQAYIPPAAAAARNDQGSAENDTAEAVLADKEAQQAAELAEAERAAARQAAEQEVARQVASQREAAEQESVRQAAAQREADAQAIAQQSAAQREAAEQQSTKQLAAEKEAAEHALEQNAAAAREAARQAAAQEEQNKAAAAEAATAAAAAAAAAQAEATPVEAPFNRPRPANMDFFSAAPPTVKSSDHECHNDGAVERKYFPNPIAAAEKQDFAPANSGSVTSDVVARLAKARASQAEAETKHEEEEEARTVTRRGSQSKDTEARSRKKEDSEPDSKKEESTNNRSQSRSGSRSGSRSQLKAPSTLESRRKLGAVKRNAADDDEEESDDDDDDDDDNDDDNDENDDKKRRQKDKDRSKDRPKRNSQSRLKRDEAKEPEKTIEILGRPVKQSTLMTMGILAVIVGFPFMVLVSCIINIFSGTPPATEQTALQAPGQAAQQLVPQSVPQSAREIPSTMTGTWKYAFENVGKAPGQGSFSLTQKGDKLEGYGTDSTGQFQLSGELQNGAARFSKQYVKAGQAAGKPILYSGKVGVTENMLQMFGTWELTKRQGYGWRAQVVTLGGKFEARLVQPGTTGNAPVDAIAMKGPGGGATAAAPSLDANPHKAQNFFLQVALGIIGIGVVLAMLSLRFFGPSGLLNIWAKKEYIPSQFKTQHHKMVQEMGKPIIPGSIPLGTREEWGLHQFWLPRRLTLPPQVREKNPHMFIVGAGATGKTRLMASMIAQDIESNDRAVVLVDSDGGLADLVLNWISSRPNGVELSKRVILVDPTYQGGKPLGFNPLEFPEDGDLQNAASALVQGFKAAYTEPPGAQSQWNQQTANILRNSSILLMANNKTLTDLPVLLSDNDFRDVLLEKIEQLKTQRSEFITLLDAWTNYKRLARTDQWITWIEPILNRVQPMLSDPRIRGILTKEKSELNLKKVIADRRVLIVKIPQGQLDKNGNLLGSLLVAGLKQAALSLCARSKYKRRPCSLYLDEFESFIEKETFDAITTETRKLQIGFCGASKTLQTMQEDFRNKIIINSGIMAIFALAKKDGDMLGPQMFRVDGRKVKHQTIQNVFNKVNSSPQFELIMDEEKLNIDRVVGQEKRTYFCYRVGSVAGVFHMKAPEFNDIPEHQINKDLMTRMHSNRQDDEESDHDGDAEAEEEDDAEEEE